MLLSNVNKKTKIIFNESFSTFCKYVLIIFSKLKKKKNLKTPDFNMEYVHLCW